MKKWIIVAFSLFLLFIISVYFIIPEKILVTKSITANANQPGVYRFLTDESNWTKWWPGTATGIDGSDKTFESGGYQFKKTQLLYNSFEIAITQDKRTDTSFLHLFSLGRDSIKIEWNTMVNAGANPFGKIRHYFIARNLSKKLENILAAMQRHISNVKNLYGTDIKKEKVKIEFLVATKKFFPHYPHTADIYEMINQIKTHISSEQAKEEDYPMLNIKIQDSTHFEAQVAIPVNKKLPDTDIFSTKQMLKNGDILVAEINGGKHTLDSVLKQIDIYASDNQYNNIAIPFQSLVTDRMKEPDSSKWVTRIYYPVM